MAIPGSTASGLDLIRNAMLDLQVIDAEQPVAATEANDCLVRLNRMLDTFSGNGFMVFTIGIQDFPLVSNKQIYTFGPGGDFNAPRPAFIDRASIVILSNPSQPLEYPIPIYTTQEWQEQVPIKNVPGNLPLAVYDDGGFPLRSLTFWPVASDNTLFRVYPWQQLTQFGDLQTPVSFPPGYLEALESNLAIRIAPMFGATVSPETAMLAISSIAQIKGNNADDTQLRSDLASSMTFSKMRSELFNIP